MTSDTYDIFNKLHIIRFFQFLIEQILQKMGCCHSQLNALSIQNKGLNTDSTGFSTQPQTQRVFVHAILSGIQEEHRKNKNQRTEQHLNKNPPIQFNSYLKSVVSDLVSQQKKFGQIVCKAKSQLGFHEIQQKQIHADIRSYLSERGIEKNDVKEWIKEKIIIAKQNGKNLLTRIKNSNLTDSDKRRNPEILQIVIQDQIKNDKGFLLSIAYEFFYQNDLPQSVQWQKCLSQIYLEPSTFSR